MHAPNNILISVGIVIAKAIVVITLVMSVAPPAKSSCAKLTLVYVLCMSPISSQPHTPHTPLPETCNLQQ